jgi:hypothetical protein
VGFGPGEGNEYMSIMAVVGSKLVHVELTTFGRSDNSCFVTADAIVS